MASKPETTIVNAIMRQLDRLPRCWYFKVHGGVFQAAGVPDLIICLGGRFCALEVKDPLRTTRATKSERWAREKLTTLGIKAFDAPKVLQGSVMRRMHAAGAVVGVATNVQEALEILEEAT